MFWSKKKLTFFFSFLYGPKLTLILERNDLEIVVSSFSGFVEEQREI